MARPTTIEEKMDTAKGRILASAVEVFAQKGYSGATTREIVKNAGSSLSMLNLCFGSKEALYEEVLKEVLSIYVYGTLPLFGEIVAQREQGTMTPQKAWEYIEKITEIHLGIITDPKNQYIIMLLNHELQNKERFEINLEPALMYIYNYQMLFEDYTQTPYGSWWARILSFQTVTGMFNLMTFPKLINPLGEINPLISEAPIEFAEIVDFIKKYHLTAMKAALEEAKRKFVI